jgi:hypothetical protein
MDAICSWRTCAIQGFSLSSDRGIAPSPFAFRA